MTEYSPEDRTSSPEAIERDIEQTRERMSQNIDALGHKLSPRNLKQQAKEAISGAAHDAAASVSDKARRTGSKVIESLRENAIPVAMVGAGVTWMIMKRSDASSQRRGFTTGGYSGEERRGVSRYVGTTSAREEFGYGSPSYRGSYGSAEAAEGHGIRQKVSHAADAVGEKVSHAASAVGDKVTHAASSVGEKVSDAASTVADKTGVLARRVGDLGGEARDRVQHAGSRARGSFERTLEENPLAIAAGAAVLGLAIGLLFPATRRENEMMGPTRDRLIDTAQETARTVKEVARERTQVIATEKAPELKEAARELVEQVKEGAERVAQETKDAAKATVKETSARRSNA